MHHPRSPTPRKHPPTPPPPRGGKENAVANQATPPRRRSLPRAPPPPPPAPRAPCHAHLRSLLKSMAELAATTPAARADLLADRDAVLSGAVRAAGDIRTPPLLRATATLLARLAVDARPAAALCAPPFLPALESCLAPAPPAPGPDVLAARDAARLAARAVRNACAFTENNATLLARDSAVVRLLVARLVDALAARPRPEAVECAAALANFARHGLQFQAYVRKHGGLPALSTAAQQADDLACKFHACRALAEFSLDHKWLMLLVAEGCIATMLRIIEASKDEEILSESTRFLGNIATSRIGREAINSANGIDRLVHRVLTIVHVSRESEKTELLTIDLLRTISNLCVNCKNAAQRLINRGGIIAFIEAYGDADSSAPDQIRTEAFRGLLIIAQGGHGFRASVLREIGIKIRQDTCQGRCTAHLYDLGRRIKVEASTEREDDFPLTIAGLGERSKEYLFQAGPLAAEKDFSPSSVPDMQSPAAAGFRQSGRLLSVQRPVPHRERLERDRRERPPRMPAPAPQVVDGHIVESPRRPRAGSSDGVGQQKPSRPGSSPNEQQRPHSADAGRQLVRRGVSEPNNLDQIPRCKVIENGKGRNPSGDGNWVLAVWSAVCNAVTRPPNAPSPRPRQIEAGSSENGSESDEEGEDVFEMGVPLGRGGFATVYLAKNLRTGELVAVKRFHPLSTSTPDARKKAELAARRAMKEQRIWDGLLHKNVVSYRGCFFGENGELNLVAEYIPGWSLADHLSQINKFPEHMVACITRQIVEGLNYLHKSGITHRDVKPANILVNPEGIIKITDFGVSSAVDVPTMTGNTLVGTPWYIAPEMIEGRPYGKSVDIWSLGCTVLELATGRRPYHNMRPHVAMFRMTQDRMPQIPKNLSPVLRDFLKTCWVWNPAERPNPAHLRRHPFLAAVDKPQITNLKGIARKV